MVSIVAFCKQGTSGNYRVGILLDLLDTEQAEVGIWLYDAFIPLKPVEIQNSRHVYYIVNQFTPIQVLRIAIKDVDRDLPQVVNCELTENGIELHQIAEPYSLIPFHEIILADLDTFTEHEEEIVDIEDFPGIAQVRRLLLQPSE
jgi:hypothetical protein